jgi:hypothetical protein
MEELPEYSADQVPSMEHSPRRLSDERNREGIVHLIPVVPAGIISATIS